MDYAVVFYFDNTTEQRIQTLITDVAICTGNSYMTDVGIPPHLTIGMYRSDDEERIKSEFERCADEITCGEVFWASIGIFNPHVLFLAPVLNEYLQRSCELVNRAMSQIADVGDFGHYMPYQWVPHTAIAVKLTPEQLKIGFDVVQQQFTPIGSRVERLILARCNPFHQLCVHQIHGG